MICDMADVDMTYSNEEEKNSKLLAPTPSAAHNPGFTKMSDGNEFRETKTAKMSKTAKKKETSDTSHMPKMSNISINDKNACSVDDLAKPPETPISLTVKVAGP